MKKNIFSSYVSQIYMTLIGILMVPMYVKRMGVEAYGLVGFFSMLQAWFQLLDMGLTPTLARETARFRGGAISSQDLRRLLRTLEGIFLGVAILGAGGMILGSRLIACHWLKVRELPIHEVYHAIQLMAIIIALRWICGLYRGVITGFEHLVWLSSFNMVIATLRFVMVVPVLIFVGHSPTIFFEFQALLAVVEAAVLIFESYRLIPKVESGIRTPWEWGPIKGVLKFSMGVAFTGTVWVFVTQMDKLLLSKLLPLSEYAYFSLAVLAASGITILSVPISSVLLPRMTKLNTENDDEGVIAIYRGATQVVGFLAVPSAFTLILFSQRVLWVWTGNPGVAISAGPILVLYSLGNLCLVYSAFPYYLQFAKGDLKLHVLGNALFLLVLIPSLIWATGRYGAVGAGWAWFGSNLLYLLLWTPVVHRRFSRGVHFRWLFGDLGGVILPVFIGAIVIRQFLSFPPGRMGSAVFVFLQGFLLLGLALAGSSFARGKILERVRAVRTSGGGI